MSLRVAISLTLMLVLASVGVLAAAVSYGFAAFEAGQFMDDQMRQLAGVVDERTRLIGAGTSLREPEDRFAVAVWPADGREAVLAGPDLPVDPTGAGFSTRTIGGEAWQILVLRAPERTVRIAQRMSARDEIATHAALEVAASILAVIPLAWVAVAIIVSRLFRELTALSRTVSARGTEADAPLPTETLPREIRPFVVAINGLLERLRLALDQQRRFIADSAHQLRTPLAALRLQIDGLRGQGMPEGADVALHGGMVRIGVLLNQLLQLARFDMPSAAKVPESVDLVELLTQCIACHIELAEERGIDLGLGEAQRARVFIVRNDIHLLVANLVDNAVRYTPSGGRVDCTVERDATRGWRLSVSDTGPGVRDSDLPRLTDRFFRTADAPGPGSGLGLAIVEAIADRHGLTLEIANRPDRSGLIVCVGFPAVCEIAARSAMPVGDGRTLASARVTGTRS